MRLERKRKIFYKIKMTVYLISRRKMQWERKRKDILQKDWRETYIHIWTISISCLSWVGTVHMDMFTFLLYTGYACMHDVTSWHSTSFLQICFKSLESFCSSASFPYFFLLVVFINKLRCSTIKTLQQMHRRISKFTSYCYQFGPNKVLVLSLVQIRSKSKICRKVGWKFFVKHNINVGKWMKDLAIVFIFILITSITQ